MGGSTLSFLFANIDLFKNDIELQSYYIKLVSLYNKGNLNLESELTEKAVHVFFSLYKDLHTKLLQMRPYLKKTHDSTTCDIFEQFVEMSKSKTSLLDIEQSKTLAQFNDILPLFSSVNAKEISFHILCKSIDKLLIPLSLSSLSAKVIGGLNIGQGGEMLSRKYPSLTNEGRNMVKYWIQELERKREDVGTKCRIS